ncbi:unnamed protein product [Nezara viridula]|uniref:Uncharacterized protein n=1 Tax=Nezara viridula TaxID=85310 RepID=A0A9P0H2Y8_NEZVI|nr:unnamed protein product [Nezara viridula]
MHHDPLFSAPDGYTIKRVPIGLISDSVFTPDLPLRATQPTIGYFLEEKKSASDDSYGVHRSKYGGTGEIKRVLGKYEMITARKTNSFRTALDCSPEPPMTKKIMAKRILDNKPFFAGPIDKVACDVFQLATQSKPLPLPAPKQFFPRSVVYEIEFVKEQYRKAMMDALEKERKEFEELIKKQKNVLKDKPIEGKNLNSNNQEESTLPEKAETTGIMTDEHIQDGEDAIKFGNLNKNDAVSCISVCGLCGCTLTRGACLKCNTEKESLNLEVIFDKANVRWKPEPPKYGSSWSERRQKEMMKVNYPFRTEVTRWYYQSSLPFDASTQGSLKTKFAEKKFSSLNI